jgi:hypothetical protein
VSFWGTPNVVFSRQQNEWQLPFRRPGGNDSASGRQKISLTPDFYESDNH